MNPIIENIIPQQGFEVVRNQIVGVILLEMTDQSTRQTLPGFSVFAERGNPYDKSENVLVNVSFNGATNSGFSESSYKSECTFNLDIYANGKSSSTNTGDLEAVDKRNRIAGVVRYVLATTKYRHLQLPKGLITATRIESMQAYEVGSNQDGSFNKMIRLVYRVDLIEGAELWTPKALEGITTQINLELTENGYQIKT